MIFYHRGSYGDIVYSLPTLISFGGGKLCLRKQSHYNFMSRILINQPYISEVTYLDKTNFNEIDINLDAFRKVHKKDLKKHLAQCHLDAFDKHYNLYNKWIHEISPIYKADIIIQVTPRYHNGPGINWKPLRKFLDRCLFIGFDSDFKYFKSKTKYNIPHIECQNSYELAQFICGSKLFIGNQSVGFALAEGMKHPRILDHDEIKNNCQPYGKHGYIQLTKEIIEKYV